MLVLKVSHLKYINNKAVAKGSAIVTGGEVGSEIVINGIVIGILVSLDSLGRMSI